MMSHPLARDYSNDDDNHNDDDDDEISGKQNQYRNYNKIPSLDEGDDLHDILDITPVGTPTNRMNEMDNNNNRREKNDTVAAAASAFWSDHHNDEVSSTTSSVMRETTTVITTKTSSISHPLQQRNYKASSTSTPRSTSSSSARTKSSVPQQEPTLRQRMVQKLRSNRALSDNPVKEKQQQQPQQQHQQHQQPQQQYQQQQQPQQQYQQRKQQQPRQQKQQEEKPKNPYAPSSHDAFSSSSSSSSSSTSSPSPPPPLSTTTPSSRPPSSTPTTTSEFDKTLSSLSTPTFTHFALTNNAANNNPPPHLPQSFQNNAAENDDDFLSKAESVVMSEVLCSEQSSSPLNSPTGFQQLPPPPPPPRNNPSSSTPQSSRTIRPKPEDLSSGMLPDVLMTMRQKIESLTMFDSDMIRLAGETSFDDEDSLRSKESLRRSFQQSISAAVLVSLAHKRYERRRLAAMEIEKVVRSLVLQNELERVRAILLLLSDDYVRSTSEDARKGGVVALAACAIGLKKAVAERREVRECKDLILAAVVHACQDHSQRVRYYATESLFNVVKVIPTLAVKHFFTLFEILRSLYADVDLDVRSGAQLLDKKLKEVIVAAINNGSFAAEACVPLFARYVHVRNKPTKRLTLTWLQEFSGKLVGSPILEFLHLFLGGVFVMLSDPNNGIRSLALSFLECVLPQLLVTNEDFEDGNGERGVDFDKILQSLVTTMEHPDPFVRKVAMYWMSRIVKAHMSDGDEKDDENGEGKEEVVEEGEEKQERYLTAASISVRNCLPHVLPGILLSIGDTFHTRPTNPPFLSDISTHTLAEQTNTTLQNAVRRHGKAYVSHLDGFIVALHEELDSPGGLSARNPPAMERKPYRMDVKSDGSGIESTGWFRTERGQDGDGGDAMMMSRLCALQWVVVLYESVVPDSLKAEYAREFIPPIIHQLVSSPPNLIIFKSFEVLAKITVPVPSENYLPSTPTSNSVALDILPYSHRQLLSRDRNVFSTTIQLHSHHHRLLQDVSRVVEFMCTLQPPAFVFVSFALELDQFATRKKTADDLEFVSSFVQQMNNVLLTSPEARELREVLRDCIGGGSGERDERKVELFRILLHAFSHNLVATLSLCLWGGAFQTASVVVHRIDPLDINLLFYLELDRLIELLERPLFRHLHLRLLDGEVKSMEGSGAMLFLTLKSMLMLLPQSTSYNVLKNRLFTAANFRKSIVTHIKKKKPPSYKDKDIFVERVSEVRKMHCEARWRSIREGSLEPQMTRVEDVDENEGRRDWLGFENEDEEKQFKHKMSKEREKIRSSAKSIIKTITEVNYDEFHSHPNLPSITTLEANDDNNPDDDLPLRHPDDVLPKDQIHNFQALTRRGLIHQARNESMAADLKPTGMMGTGTTSRGIMGARGDLGAPNKEGEDGQWKEYWLQTGADS